MEQRTPAQTGEREQGTLGLDLTNEIAVSAAELIEMIRSGDGEDVNELVRRTLDDRHAA